MVNRYVLLASAALASPAAAQVSNTVGTVPVPPSQPAPTPTPTPAAPLPTLTPDAAPVAPPPVVTTVTPTPTPSTSPRRRDANPPPRTAPRSTPTPATAPTPTPSPSPSASLAPAALPTPIAVPSPTPTATASAPAAGGLPWWAIPAGLVALLLIGAAGYALRRRDAEEPEPMPMAEEPAPLAAPLPLARDAVPSAPLPQFLEPAAPLAPRASLSVAVVPRRAGVNLLTATADVEVTVTNEGDAPASNIHVGAQLTSAQPGQDDALGELFAAPVTRPAAAPFDLAPGESHTVRTLLTLARDAIVVLAAAERPMFIPVVAINVTYARGDGQAGQSAAAFAVGVERDGVAKLAPFWLDGPSRMHDRLGVRPHALALKS